MYIQSKTPYQEVTFSAFPSASPYCVVSSKHTQSNKNGVSTTCLCFINGCCHPYHQSFPERVLVLRQPICQLFLRDIHNLARSYDTHALNVTVAER